MRQISGMWVIAALSAGLVGQCASQLHAADQRTFGEGGYVLQIGNETESVHSLEGGSPVAQVAEEKVTGTDLWPHKHVANVKVEDVRARISPDQFTKFLSQSLSTNTRSDGAMYLLSGLGQVEQQRTLIHMMLDELTIPTLSGASKDPLYLQIGLAVEQSTLIKGGSAPAQKLAPRTKAALASSFALTIPGLTTNRVASIDPITMHRKLASDTLGEMRDYAKQPSLWEVSNIVFYVAAADAQQYLDWLDDFLVKGNHTSDKERTLSLELKASDLKTNLLTLNATGVGIVSAKYVTPGAATDAVVRLRVEVYAEKMSLDPGKASVDPQPQPTNDPKPDSRGTIRRPVETPLRGRGR